MLFKKLIVILLLVVITSYSYNAFGNTVFEKNVRVDDTGKAFFVQKHPSIALGKTGTIYITFDDDRDRPKGQYDIFFTKSIDGGKTFSPNQKISDSTANEHKHSQIILDKNENIYVTFDSKYGHNKLDLYFTKSIDGGKSFSKAVQINIGDYAGSYREYSSMALGRNGEIYVAWWDSLPGKDDVARILFSKSLDGGKTFEKSVLIESLGNLENQQTYPQIVVDKDGVIYLTAKEDFLPRYDKSSIYLVKSSDGGKTFIGVSQVNPKSQNAWITSIVRFLLGPNDDMYIVWSQDDQANHNIYFSKSSNKGVTFTTPLRINDNQALTKDRYYPVFAINAKGKIDIVWEDYRLGRSDIFFAESNDDGKSFGPSIHVDDAVGDSPKGRQYPDIALDNSGEAYIVWDDFRNGDAEDLYFAKGFDPAQVKPDLTITQFFPEYPAQGGIDADENTAKESDKLFLTTTFQNIGQVTAKAFKIGFSVDGKILSPLTISINSLAPDEIKTYATSIPWVARIGRHKIKAIIDLDNDIPELNELNNVINKQINVKKAQRLF